jgi:hypothetical protein
MNVEIGTEAALFPEKEYIKGIFVAVYISKSFYVSEFGKVEVTSTPAESSFFKALVLLKL